MNPETCLKNINIKMPYANSKEVISIYHFVVLTVVHENRFADVL